MRLLPATELELATRSETFRAIIARRTVIPAVPVGKRNQQNLTTFCISESPANSDVRRVSHKRGDEWAVAVEAGDKYCLYLAFDENWQRITADSPTWQRKLLSLAADSRDPHRTTRTKRAQGEDWVFDGIGLRFYIEPLDKSGGGGIYPWVRCEWPNYRQNLNVPEAQDTTLTPDQRLLHSITFDDCAAAQPHFHFDAIHLNAAFRAKLASDGSAAGGFTAFAADLGGGTHPAFNELARGVLIDESDISRMHLPIMAEWKVPPEGDPFGPDLRPATVGRLPHQHYPSSPQEVEAWFEWCLGYFRQQFISYVADR